MQEANQGLSTRPECELTKRAREEAERALKERALELGPSKARIIYWKITDAAKWLRYNYIDGLGLGFWVVTLGTLFYIGHWFYQTNLLLNTVLILAAPTFFTLFVTLSAYFGDPPSTEDGQLERRRVVTSVHCLWLAYVFCFTQVIALAPCSAYVGVRPDGRCTDYGAFWWFKNPVEEMRDVQLVNVRFEGRNGQIPDHSIGRRTRIIVQGIPANLDVLLWFNIRAAGVPELLKSADTGARYVETVLAGKVDRFVVESLNEIEKEPAPISFQKNTTLNVLQQQELMLIALQGRFWSHLLKKLAESPDPVCEFIPKLGTSISFIRMELGAATEQVEKPQ